MICSLAVLGEGLSRTLSADQWECVPGIKGGRDEVLSIPLFLACLWKRRGKELPETWKGKREALGMSLQQNLGIKHLW